MGHDNGRVAARVLEDVMRARDPSRTHPSCSRRRFISRLLVSIRRRAGPGWSIKLLKYTMCNCRTDRQKISTLPFALRGAVVGYVPEARALEPHQRLIQRREEA
jgi:hypothetical protein